MSTRASGLLNPRDYPIFVHKNPVIWLLECELSLGTCVVVGDSHRSVFVRLD
jgi:hypothetical protein